VSFASNLEKKCVFLKRLCVDKRCNFQTSYICFSNTRFVLEIRIIFCRVSLCERETSFLVTHISDSEYIYAHISYLRGVISSNVSLTHNAINSAQPNKSRVITATEKQIYSLSRAEISFHSVTE